MLTTEEICKYPWHRRSSILFDAFRSAMATGELDEAAHVLGLYRCGLVDDTIINASNEYILKRTNQGWTVVATTDPSRAPVTPTEIVICYGNFPHSPEALPATNHVFRYPTYFMDIVHTTVESHPAWHRIDRIHVITIPSRLDRYFHLLLELCRAGAPLDRIQKYEGGFTAFTGNKDQDKYICASFNHYDVAKQLVEHPSDQVCLVLEDDFSFIGDLTTVHRSLEEFFERDYGDYYVCFLSYSKYGDVVDLDDLISYSKQYCTTSSGYLLKKETAGAIAACHKEGIEQMKVGGSPNTYCCDRFWCRYGHENKMLVFRRKLGFQYVTHSDLVNGANLHFD